MAGIDTRPTELLRATRSDEAAPCCPRRAKARTRWPTTAPSASACSAIRSPCCVPSWPPSGSRPRRACAPFRTAGWRAPAAWSRTGSGPRRPRARSSSPSRTRTGAVNVIVWPRIAEMQRKPLLGATLLTVYGQWQRQGEGDQATMHLLASKMIDHTSLLQGLVSRSRDFR